MKPEKAAAIVVALDTGALLAALGTQAGSEGERKAKAFAASLEGLLRPYFGPSGVFARSAERRPRRDAYRAIRQSLADACAGIEKLPSTDAGALVTEMDSTDSELWDRIKAGQRHPSLNTLLYLADKTIRALDNLDDPEIPPGLDWSAERHLVFLVVDHYRSTVDARIPTSKHGPFLAFLRALGEMLGMTIGESIFRAVMERYPNT